MFQQGLSSYNLHFLITLLLQGLLLFGESFGAVGVFLLSALPDVLLPLFRKRRPETTTQKYKTFQGIRTALLVFLVFFKRLIL